jgi:threonine/homoserine/homoserine lactone efflux protein
MEVGWRQTLPAALAPLLSDGPIILLVLFLLTQTPAQLLQILQICGGIFLIFLAIASLRSLRQVTTVDTSEPRVLSSGLLKAVLTNLLNPNPYIFWGTVAGPILLEAMEQSIIDGIGFLVGFYMLLVGGFLAFISLFASGRRLAPQHIPKFLIFAAIALGAFGVFQLYAGITA